jgi:hypothetical protein
MFSTKGQEVKGGGASKSLQPGVVYAHIVSGQVRTSNKGDKKQLELVLEGPALPNFEGWAIDKTNPEGPKFKGQSSRVSATIWIEEFNTNDINKNEILNKIIIIGKELGLRASLDNISTEFEINSIEDWVGHAIDLLKGNDLYWFLKGTEEEYNGKTIVKLSLPKYKFCSADEAKLDKFDKNNKYHYKAMENKSVDKFEPANDDFNF